MNYQKIFGEHHTWRRALWVVGGALAIVVLIVNLLGCASLERDLPAPPVDSPDVTETLPDPPGPMMPDAGVPHEDGETCPIPPPPCSCDDDCSSGEKCFVGKCYERCDCEDDCKHLEDRGNNFECRWGICKRE